MPTSKYQELVALARRTGAEHCKLDPTSRMHGLGHWDRVLANARTLVSRMESGADLNIAVWFAYLHDAQRENDREDPDHGLRAVKLSQVLWDRGVIRMSLPSLSLLQQALADHSKGFTTGPLIVRICWDADRLDLPRCGVSPAPSRMATSLGRQMAQNLQKNAERRDVLVTPQYGRPRP